MCDGYSQSMQHLRTVAWLERGPLMVHPADDANASTSHAARGRLNTAARSPRRRVWLLRAAAAGSGAQSVSVEPSPASR